MSSQGRTLGTWGVGPLGGVFASTDAGPSSGDIICETYGGTERYDNARLIAAAPDLLVALCAILRCIEMPVRDEAEEIRVRDVTATAIDIARAAIAKAGGEARSNDPSVAPTRQFPYETI